MFPRNFGNTAHFHTAQTPNSKIDININWFLVYSGAYLKHVQSVQIIDSYLTTFKLQFLSHYSG
jgi:hypothetical protein